MNLLKKLFQWPAIKREIDEELRFHIEQRTAENIANSMTPADAAREARKRFGNVQSVREECRENRGASFGETFVRDSRFAVRQLVKNPGFTTVAVLTLALGIGANTAIFSFVDTILLKPLPYSHPDRLVQLFESNLPNGWHKGAIGAPVIAEWRKQANLFEGIAARGNQLYSLTGRGDPVVLSGAPVSANTFSLLGIKPLLGRDFLPEEETYGKHHVVLLSYESWQRRFGGDRSVIGQNLTFNGEAYQTQNLVNLPFGLPDKSYPSPGAKLAFFDRFRERVAGIPGVDSVALIYGLPLGFETSDIAVEIAGAPKSRPGEPASAGYSQISPGYFQTLGIPILQGRDFTNLDRTNTIPVLIVDQTFARNFKLGANPVGRLVNVGDGTQKAEIVGLVKDVKRREDLTDASRGEMYRPFLQKCWGYMNLTLRTRRAPEEITRAIRVELDQLDKDLPIEKVSTLTQLMDAAVAQRRLSVQLLGGFSGMALLLTAIGLYGVMAYNVSQRSREIGIRMALGAEQRDVLKLVLREGMMLMGIGVIAGLGGALALTRLLRSLLFGVTATDPLTYLLVPLVLVGVALVACFIPARRAAKVDPMVALRNE